MCIRDRYSDGAPAQLAYERAAHFQWSCIACAHSYHKCSGTRLSRRYCTPGQFWFSLVGKTDPRRVTRLREWLHFVLYHAGMKKQASLVQYTVRGVPREVDIILRRKAAKRKLSLNRMIVEQLSEAAVGARAGDRQDHAKG